MAPNPPASGQVVHLPPGETTPAGGVAFVVWYFDAEGGPLPGAAGAAMAEIHELDDDGTSVQRTYGTIS